LKRIYLNEKQDQIDEMLIPRVSHETALQVPNTILTLIDSIPAWVAYIDCNMILQYCNQPFKMRFPLVNNIAQKSFPLIVGDEIFSQQQRHMGKVLIGERAHFQISIDSNEGTQFLDATLSPDFDRRKKVKGFIFHCSDITEKNRTEWALKDYFENASIGLHWVNAAGIIIWANPAEMRMLGYTESEYIGHHISEFHADKNLIGDILKRLGNNQPIRSQEADLLCKDGSIRHVSINSTVLWQGNRFIHTRCFTVDLTEQKRAVRAVKESEERFRMIANLAPLVIWTTDVNGYCNFLSVRWEEITGKPIEDGLGEQWSNFIHPEDRGNIVHSWKTSFSAKKQFEAKFRFLSSAGTYRTHYANSTPRYNAIGQFEGYIGILQDISSEEYIRSSLEKIVLERTEDLRKRNAELKIAEKELQEKNKELEEINNQLSSFAHIASHDLQEPLRKIELYTDRLFELEGNRFSEKGKELFQRIHHVSGRMRTLIGDLLTYSKSTNNEDKAEYVDFNLLVNEVINELEIKIAEKNVKIENHGLPRLPVIKFQFHQLFLNLLSNAIKFTSKRASPCITIQSQIANGNSIPGEQCEVEKSYHHITITDNGIGFEPKYAEKIFEMFHRLHARAEYEGTGIGLAICKKIVENHKGFIMAEGQPNMGATFHIYLPA
jgi:PAS domain S-box-containing protein